MEKKTGGHWRPCNVGVVEAHNERRQDYLEGVKNAGLKIYFREDLTKNNSSWVNNSERYRGKTVDEVFEEMKKTYTEKTGQSPQLKERERINKKTGKKYKVAGWSPIKEMCPPIKEDTTLEDFDFFLKWAASHGIEILRIDLHKDEGHYDRKTHEWEPNYHAHVTGVFFDWETGNTLKFDGKGDEVMSEMQTVLAVSLGMKRGERKKDTGAKALTATEWKLKKLQEDIDGAAIDLAKINKELAQAEKRIKGLTTMINNLEEQKERIEIDIAALDEMNKNGEITNEELKKKKDELEGQLQDIETKISDKTAKLSDAQKKLEEIAVKKHQLQNSYDDLQRKINEDKTKQKVFLKKCVENNNIMLEHFKKKEEEIRKNDQRGMIERREQWASDREEVIFKLWPEAKEAVKAIVERGTKPVDCFTPEQACIVSDALNHSSLNRQEAANSLVKLAERDFSGQLSFPNWIQETTDEVLAIANHVHPFSAFLDQQAAGIDGGGGSGGNDLPKDKDDDRFTGYQGMKPKGRK